jgi:hypothetical protein
VSTDRDLVMKVLEGQSPDYWIFPNAAAFAAEELDPRQVAETLDDLLVEGVVERELLIVDGEGANDGGVEYVPGGYRLVPKAGKKK